MGCDCSKAIHRPANCQRSIIQLTQHCIRNHNGSRPLKYHTLPINPDLTCIYRAQSKTDREEQVCTSQCPSQWIWHRPHIHLGNFQCVGKCASLKVLGTPTLNIFEPFSRLHIHLATPPIMVTFSALGTVHFSNTWKNFQCLIHGKTLITFCKEFRLANGLKHWNPNLISSIRIGISPPI